MAYLMAGQLSELDRLQLQARVWEPAGERLLELIGDGSGRRVVDVGCGCFGWLRILSRWIGPAGTCVGTDIAEDMLAAARALVHDEGLRNVDIASDDLFDSHLPAGSFDLVHARFQLAPLGRSDEQLAALTRLIAPGGVLVIEDPDTASWHYTPDAPETERLIELIRKAFISAGGDLDAGRHTYELLSAAGLRPEIRAEIVALEPGHPYLRLPLQFAASLRPRLLKHVPADELDALLAAADVELSQPTRMGLPYTLMQTWAVVD